MLEESPVARDEELPRKSERMFVLVGNGNIIRVVRFRVRMGMVVFRIPMPVFMGVDHYLSGTAAFHAVLRTDRAYAFTFRTCFGLNHFCLLFRNDVLCG
jgi:hypothetical protein